jgi:hypothetical protein
VHGALAERVEIDRCSQRASDQALNLARAAAEGSVAPVPVLAFFRIGARVHLVLGRDPALAAALHELRDRRIDRCRAQHHRTARAIECRPFREPVETRLHSYWTNGSGVPIGARAGHAPTLYHKVPLLNFLPFRAYHWNLR